jgi:hypothetical protein
MDGMSETYFVRFSDYEFYDIENDRDALRMMATTPEGTFSADIENQPGSKNRERREAFRDYVLGCLASKVHPHEIEIG